MSHLSPIKNFTKKSGAKFPQKSIFVAHDLRTIFHKNLSCSRLPKISILMPTFNVSCPRKSYFWSKNVVSTRRTQVQYLKNAAKIGKHNKISRILNLLQQKFIFSTRYRTRIYNKFTRYRWYTEAMSTHRRENYHLRRLVSGLTTLNLTKEYKMLLFECSEAVQ